MKIEKLLAKLQEADTIKEIERVLSDFSESHQGEVKWVAVGRTENNSGIINVATDPGRSLVERLTNAIDGVLEREHEGHNGKPDCRSPREAANAWLGIPLNGLDTLTLRERQAQADNITIQISEGEGEKRTDARTVQIRDKGVGITPEKMPDTILSLNASNKWKKHYLSGTFGQGGSSTFATSKYTLIASRYDKHPMIGFTVVKYLDLPPEEYKTGHYVYLTLNDSVLQSEIPIGDFPRGTLVKHFGYDLSGYPSPLGPNSVYGLLNQTLFDPILPVWLDDRVHTYRRVIKGSCNALRGAVDEGDDKDRGSKVVHHAPTFYVEVGDFGRIGIEYWVLEPGNKENKKPSASFVNPAKPIILTINGQNQAEITAGLIRKGAELPYLTQRVICHVNCDRLTPQAKSMTFASTRESARHGLVYSMIQEEIVRIFRSDDELRRLNEEARKQGNEETDQSALQSMRKEIARLLRLQGLNIGEGGPTIGGDGPDKPVITVPPRPPRVVIPIPPIDPPTYIHIVSDEEKEITFYPEQRRYIRIETDALSRYHDPNGKNSAINIILGEPLLKKGTTPLLGGRMRVAVEAPSQAVSGNKGVLRVELTRPGLPTLFDERPFRIVPKPPVKPSTNKLTLPPFRFVQIDGPDDPRWIGLDWPTDVKAVASSAGMENGEMVINYSTVFPRFASSRNSFETRDPASAKSFVERYQIWLAVHSFLLHGDEEEQASDSNTSATVSEEADSVNDLREREERCRVATLSALFASREVLQGTPGIQDDAET